MLAGSTENYLLASLSGQSRQRLLARLKPVTLNLGDILCEPGEPITTVYFPIDSLVSILAVAEKNLALEVGMIGREGLFLGGLALGVKHSPVRALVQGAGTALSMSAAPFMKEFDRSRPLQQKVGGFTHELLRQIAQSAACNRYHNTDARLARWLLMTRDRVASVEFPLTHQFLADMLGVRRERVSHAAKGLQRRNLIEYRRGKMRILEARGLTQVACACYDATRGAYKKNMPS